MTHDRARIILWEKVGVLDAMLAACSEEHREAREQAVKDCLDIIQSYAVAMHNASMSTTFLIQIRNTIKRQLLLPLLPKNLISPGEPVPPTSQPPESSPGSQS